MNDDFGPPAMLVFARTDGSNPDLNGYLVVLDDTLARPITVNGQTFFAFNHRGMHIFELRDVAANCNVTSENPITREVTVSEQIHFAVSCGQFEEGEAV